MPSTTASHSTSSRLDWDDPFRLQFDATVKGHQRFGERASIVLDQSAFYPESGGQMGDHGVLTFGDVEVRVVDTQIDGDGVVHHIIDSEGQPDAGKIAVGAALTGTIDPQRRKEFAALHTGQHVLSSALMQVWGADTLSSRLGESGCNIDVDKGGVNEAKVAEAEALANAIVDAALEVRQFFPTDAELADLKFRRTPKVTDGIRVVTVGDFDVTPCGGTHVRNSSEIGLVRVTHVERAKGKVRVMFESGPRARSTLFATHGRMRDLAASLTCGADEVPRAIEKLRESLSSSRSALGAARTKLADREVAALIAAMPNDGDKTVVADFDGDASFLRQIAPRLFAGGATAVVLTARHDEGVALFCARGEGASTLNCGALVKSLCAEFEGRGGGKPERAEGRLPPTTSAGALAASVATHVSAAEG